MVEVRDGIIYRDGKAVRIEELPNIPFEEFADKRLYSAVREAQRKGKPLAVVDAGVRKGVGKVYVVINTTRDGIEWIRKNDIFVGNYGFSSMSHLLFVRFFSYAGSDLKGEFFKNFIVHETPNLKKYMEAFKRKVEEAESPEFSAKDEKELKSSLLFTEKFEELYSILMPHQKKFLKVAIERINQLKGKDKKLGLFLADDMGLGKTLQTLAFAEGTGAFPLMIICPKSAALVWEGEVEGWLGRKAKVYTTKDDGLDPEYDVHIVPISLFSLKRFKDKLPGFWKGKVRLLVIDESHTIKNYTANRTKTVRLLIRNLRRRNPDLVVLALSGTPQTVSPTDYIPQLDVIGFLENEKVSIADFRKRYLKTKKVRARDKEGNPITVEVADGTKHPYELNLWLKSTVMVKRKREDALKNLPEKGVIVDRIPLSKKDEYEAKLNAFKEDPKNYQELRQWISREKVPYTVKLVREALEEGRKVVVLAHYKETQEFLKKELEKTVKEFGKKMVYFSPNAKNRKEIVERFQTDKDTVVFLGSFQSAKQSITLTSANTMIIHDVPSVYADKVQAEQRIHRIGQKSDVVVIYPIMTKTIEEKILKVLNKRKQEADKLLGNPRKIWEFFFGKGGRGGAPAPLF